MLYQLTLTAFLEGTRDEVWEQWIDLLSSPRFVEDNTEVNEEEA